MENEPNFIAQLGEPATPEEHLIWINAQIEAGRVAGSTFFRASYHPELADLILVEGWEKRPDDQGEPRWQFAAPGN